MNLKDYQQQASRTIPDMKNVELLTMSVISLTEEIGELMIAETQKDIISECGDICWYVCAIAKSLNIELPYIKTNQGHRMWEEDEELLNNLILSSCYISGIVKKSIWHGHEMDKRDVKTEIVEIILNIEEYAKRHNKELNQVLEANIDKLKKRYPEGFSQERSIYREGN